MLAALKKVPLMSGNQNTWRERREPVERSCGGNSSNSDQGLISGSKVKTNSVLIDSTKKSDVSRRRYDKRNSCLFCSKQLAKIGRHILSVHKNEPEVIKILATNKTSERRTKLSILRQRGNFHHNVKVKKVGGVLNVLRRPSDTVTSHDEYLPCLNCLAFVKKNVL